MPLTPAAVDGFLHHGLHSKVLSALYFLNISHSNIFFFIYNCKLTSYFLDAKIRKRNLVL